MKKITFTTFAHQCIVHLEDAGRYSTAHLYRNALRSYSAYLTKPVVDFSDISRDRLRCYQGHLTSSGHLPNTVSTYMRMLRSIYNQGTDLGYAPCVNRLFHDVYTGIDSGRKKALLRDDLQDLLYKDPGTDVLRAAQAGARLIYQLCGIPFVDLAHISHSNICGDTLEYHRMKTGTKVCVKLLKSAVDTMKSFTAETPASSDGQSKYLLHLLRNGHGFRSREGYAEYQSVLRHFNRDLSLLGRTLGLKDRISSYTLRHSWATTAKYTGAPIEMISESLGHKSIKTTQIYLAGFRASDLAEVNKKACKYVEKVK
jgi:integrase/recombinase XerD